MMLKDKICKKCNRSFVPLKRENLCFDYHYGDKKIHPETERHQEIIKKEKEK